MQVLDIKTVLLLSIIINILCAGIYTFFWTQNRHRYSGILLWGLQSILQCAGLLLLALRNVIPDFVSIILGNLLIILSASTLFIGITRFFKLKVVHWGNFIIIPLFLGVHIYFTYFQPILAMRTLNTNAGLLLIILQGLYLIFFRLDQTQRQLARFPAIVIAGIGVISLIQIMYSLTFPTNQNFLQSSTLPTLLIVADQALSILLLFSLILMIHDLNTLELEKQHKVEKENVELQAQILHTSKLASIGTLAAGIAHEINNPLAIIKGCINIFQEHLQQTGGNEKVIKRLDTQNKAVERIANIVSGLCTYARVDTSTLANINLHEVISDTMALYESLDKNTDLSIRMNLFPEPIYARANLGKLQQVFVNLLSNAKDACANIQGGGQVTIETSKNTTSSFIRFSDNGSGIAQEHIAKIFDPFFTTKPVGQGTGLGLPISISIIQSFGGTLTVTSEIGIGTSFLITLPLHKL